MDANEIRKILGIVAGAIAGSKAGKDKSIGGVGGGIAGAIGGLFSASLVNSIEKLSQKATADGHELDSSIYESVGEFRGFINGFLLLQALIMGLAEGVGLTEERIFEAMGVKNEVEAEKLLLSRRVEILTEIENSFDYAYESMEEKCGALWELFSIDKEKDNYKKFIKESINNVLARRA